MEDELCPHAKAIQGLADFAHRWLKEAKTDDDFSWWMCMSDVIYSVYVHCDGDPCRTWNALVDGIPESDGDERTTSVVNKVHELDAWVRRELQDYVERD